MKRLLLAILFASVASYTFATEYAFDYREPQVWAGKPALAVGDQVKLTLAEDLVFTLQIESAPPAGIAGQSFIAKVEGVGASAILKVTKRGLRVTIDDFEHSKLYTASYKDGEVKVKTTDTTQAGPEECGTCGEAIEVPSTETTETTDTTPTIAKRTLLGASGDAFPLAEQKSVVDILVAFDQGAVARSATLGYETIEDFADYAVDKMNTVLQNSQLDDKFCYRLVGVTEIDDTWTKINDDLLGKLRTRAGKLAKLGHLREKYGADTITLLIDRTAGTTSGIGYEYAAQYTDTSGFDGMNYACNVCDINTVYSRYTMSHETGHNMGCGHSNRQGSDSGPGRYDYSCGYHFEDKNGVKRYTIMAYDHTSPASGTYTPVPYFSTPDISPEDYGCALGVEGVNDNCQTLQNTHADIASLREHVLPYDWDVKFLDENGDEIYDGAYFDGNVTVTLTHDNSEAEIYYTLDGSNPTSASLHSGSGTEVYVYLVGGTKTLTACAVVDGKAQSVRSIALKDGFAWSGAEGENGNGLWIANDSSVKTWNASSSSFVNNYDSVVFPDLAGIESATVTVKGSVSPVASAFLAYDTAYTFKSGDESAAISLPDVSFAPAGDLTFEVPVQLAATDFTTPASHTVAFTAPFGQTIDADSGYCTNMVVVGNYGTFLVAPGEGKTQTFDRFNNTGNYYSSALFKVGAGTVRFKGDINGGKGLFGSTQILVGEGGNLVFDVGGGTGSGITSPLTVEKGGRVTYNEMEFLCRTLNLAGGNVYCKRFDWYNGPTINATDDSSIEPNGQENDAYIWIRFANATINVEQLKTLTLNVPIEGNGYNTADYGFTKTGAGELLANKPMTHTGSTIINEGTVAIGYSSSNAVGAGWTVANGARLKVKAGKLLTVPALTLESGAKIAVGAAATAPLVATDEVSVNGVLFELDGVEEFESGDEYPLVKSNTSISGVTGAKTTSLPTLSNDLKWKLEEEDGTLYAKVVEKPVAANAVSFTSNCDELTFDVPYDATIGENGGAVIDASPIVVDGTLSKKVAVAVKFVVPESTPKNAATICSLKLGGNTINCMRATNGEFNCYYNGLQYSNSSVDTVALTEGEHLLQLGYYAERNVTAEMGTRVLLDGQEVYYGTGLKFSDYDVSKVTFGATADSTPDYSYAGLEVLGVAVMDLTATTPLDRMTSNTTITYAYDKKSGIPQVFPGETGGGLGMDESVVEAAFSDTPDEVSVSVVASFPADVVGTVCGMWVQQGAAKCGLQAEYDGNGKFYIRSADNSLASYPATRLAETSLDVSKPHLYTLTFKSGDGVTFYQDGVALLKETSLFSSYNTVISPVTLGCGPYHAWRGSSWHDYPNPAKNLHIYASHIALGTSDRAESEGPVMRSMGTLPIVDVLVAYDNGAQTYVANKGVTLEKFAQTQIEKMNEVLITNKLDNCYSYRLAGVCKVAATYGKIDDVTLTLVSGEGALVSLRAARELYGADTVTLLVNTSGATLGDSIPLSSPTDVASQHECAFSVCSISAVDTGKQHTMIHENAHNMGCGHADAQAPRINSPFEYGRGYYFQDGEASLHTIMAYGGDNDASWYFSTSSSQFGLTLGDATHDNARVLRETCSEVAKWRDGSAIPLEGVEVPGAVLETSARFPWYVDDEGLVRSYNRTEYDGNQCTTPLKATVEGPKMLSFQHKSYFGGESVGGSNYSHFDVLLDDLPVLTQTECLNDWTEEKLIIPEGTHEVTFVFSQRFAMNNRKDNKDVTPEADDAVWLKDIAIGEIPKVELANKTSTSDEVEWELPSAAEAKELTDGGIEVGTKGIVQSFSFSTNAVVLSVWAELPANAEGAFIGLIDAKGNSRHQIYAYANGDGTVIIYFDNKAKTKDSQKSETLDLSVSHIWTLAYYATGGAYLYMDGTLVASDIGIKWTSNNNLHTPAECVSFGSDCDNLYPLEGMKIYAVHSEFGPDAWTRTISPIVEGAALKISEIMPKPTDDQNPGEREGMDVNGLESGWVEVENTSAKWVDLADYRFTRTNRGKKSNQADYGNFPSRLIPPYGRAIFYTSERYSNSKDKTVSAFAEGTFDGKPMIFEDYGNILVWGDKVNPKKSPFVRLYYAPNDTIESVVDTVVIPSDLPEGWSIIVGEAGEGEGTRRWMCPTPTRNAANSKTDDLTRIGPNVGPLYENKEVKKGKETIGTTHESANEFARVAPPAKPGEDYEITFSFNPVMSPTEAAGFRDEDALTAITLVYRAGFDGEEQEVPVDLESDTFDQVDWGHTYKVKIPADKLPGAGQLVQWKFKATDASGDEWTSPSFNNPDDGYEWYGTIVEAPELESATLPTWHMFATGNHLTQMDKDKDAQDLSKVPNYARIAIYDSSTSNYYDYVRIDLRGNTSAGFTKKGHGLRFAKAHPLTMKDVVSGEEIEEIRKTSLISEFADPSYMRQMIAFWLWRKMGNLVPFDFPVRCNLNGEFYQLAFNSERFTDELIEDVYKLDKFGYGYKNVGTLKSDSGTTAGKIEKKTPDDEDEGNVTVLENELRSKITAAHAKDVENDAALTKFVVEKFDLPAWINYLASARITQEMDDVWANVCAYYDNPDMLEGARGTGTWKPLGYDFNLSFGQYYYNDIKDYGNTRDGLMANQDWFKSHPLYGGNRVVAYRNSSMSSAMNGNDGFEAIYQSAKFRRLYLRRLRTLMDQELKAPGTSEGATPFMFQMRKMASIMQEEAALDQAKWPNNTTDDAIDVWTTRPADMDAGIDDIWNNYVVPRRQHLYVTHSITNTAREVGYGSNLNAGIPEAQSDSDTLKANIELDTTAIASGVVIIRNQNDEVVDMSGWTLDTGKTWTLPAGTVCDANDCIYVVADRRAYIESHENELTDQVIIGNAKFGNSTSPTIDAPKVEETSGSLSLDDQEVPFPASDDEAAKAWVETLTPTLTAEQQAAGLETQYLKVVAEPVDGETGKYKAIIDLNPTTVAAPEVGVGDSPSEDDEPVTIEEDADGKTKVSVSVSNAIKGLWYGYEVADELGGTSGFANDIESFKRAENTGTITIEGAKRENKSSGFFRVKVLPAKPTN